jgi:hypothetical protein
MPWNAPHDDEIVYDIDGGIINGIKGKCRHSCCLKCTRLSEMILGFSKPFSVHILSEELGYNKVMCRFINNILYWLHYGLTSQ